MQILSPEEMEVVVDMFEVDAVIQDVKSNIIQLVKLIKGEEL